MSHDGPPPPAWGPRDPPPLSGLEGLFADPQEPPSPANPWAAPSPGGPAPEGGPLADAAAGLSADEAAAAARRTGAHRARPGPGRYVLPAVLGAVVLVAIGVGVAGWIGSGSTTTSPGTTNAPVATGGSTASEVSPTSTSATPSATRSSAPPSPSSTPTASVVPVPPPRPAPSATGPARPPVVHAPVVVLNETTQHGLAAQVATHLRRLGWTVTGVGNWRGAVPATTVYFPAGMEAAARSLAYDLGVDRIRPRAAGMLTNRLTVVLTSDPFAT